jgi:small subunit ribosomal protein S2
MKNEGVFAILSKKESSKLEKERFRMEKSLEGIKEMKKLPDLLFIIDPSEETTAVAEARKLGIPIVAICDTNCDPDIITYPIPGNDDAIRAVKLFCSIMGDAVLEGKGMSDKQATAAAAGAELPAVDLSAPVVPVVPVEAAPNTTPGSEVIA